MPAAKKRSPRKTQTSGKRRAIDADSTGKQLATFGVEQRRHRTRLFIIAGAVIAFGVTALVVSLLSSSTTPAAPPRPEAAPTEGNAGSPALPPARIPFNPNVRRLTAQPAMSIKRPLTPDPRLAPKKLDPVELAQSIATDKTGAVQLCYEHELKKDPHLRGKVTVSLELKAPHAVTHVAVRDNLHRKTFTRCVSGALQKVFFPDLVEDLSIEIPFVLKNPEL